jgi:hypothetical protein
VGDEPPGRVIAVDGGAVRIEQAEGRRFSLVPAISGLQVTLTLFEVIPNPADGSDQVLRLADYEHLEPGMMVDLAVPEVIGRLEIVKIKPAAVVSLDQLDTTQSCLLSGDRPCTDCCVSCGGTTLCGCYVELSCGTCCCREGGCECGGASQTATTQPAPSDVIVR